MRPASREAPQLVTLHVWGVPPLRVPAAVWRMGSQRRPLRRTPGLRFAKLLGTGSGRTFAVRDADARHWGVLACWDSAHAATAFEDGPIVRAWDRGAHERLRVLLRPLAARGRWSGRAPFGEGRFGAADDPAAADGVVADGLVAAITRARIRPRRAAMFWRAVPPVSAELHRCEGVRLALGIGEAPLGVQGTFSLWTSVAALDGFAYRGPEHVAAIRRTAQTGWYAESLFARFAVLDVSGSYRGWRP